LVLFISELVVFWPHLPIFFVTSRSFHLRGLGFFPVEDFPPFPPPILSFTNGFFPWYSPTFLSLASPPACRGLHDPLLPLAILVRSPPFWLPSPQRVFSVGDQLFPSIVSAILFRPFFCIFYFQEWISSFRVQISFHGCPHLFPRAVPLLGDLRLAVLFTCEPPWSSRRGTPSRSPTTFLPRFLASTHPPTLPPFFVAVFDPGFPAPAGFRVFFFFKGHCFHGRSF